MKAINLKTIVAAFTIMLLSITTTFAQKNPHNVGVPGKGPHGGTVQEAEPNHAEVLVKDGMLQFFLLDGDAKPLPNKGVTGTVLLQFADGASKTVALMPMGAEGFMADDAKASAYSNAIVTFKVNGKSVTAKFKNKPAAKPSDHDHHH
ncbi:MAG: hypothetical protein K2X48_19360 [Chitinophagaceae bacterium]|nr:hypothetical protein [Chitinophagaceae bacterium]